MTTRTRHNRRMSAAVGVIGVGNMGLAMAQRLLDLGSEVHVRDIDPAREALAVAAGARIAATPAALAAACSIVIVAVVDAAQTEEVLFGADGAAASMRPGGCVLLCPTIAPAQHRGDRRPARGARDRRDRRADVGRPGTRARGNDEPHGRLRRRGARAPPRAPRRARRSGVSHRRRGRATARAPSSSTTCSRRSTWPAPRRRSRSPSASASTRRACST